MTHSPKTTSADTPTIGDDLLHGAEAIAVFVLGDGKHRRKVYYYARVFLT